MSSSTSELRKDSVFNRWVIFSPTRSRRPSDLFKSSSTSSTTSTTTSSCPFCAGNEHLCAPELFRFPTNNSSPWKLRLIQNLYPALSPTTTIIQQIHGSTIPASGSHDVLIETPHHSIHLPHLPPSDIAHILLAYKNRITHLEQQTPLIKYVQVFKNHGASAGASLSHSHSQIVAIPVVPTGVELRMRSLEEYYFKGSGGKCGVCVCVEEAEGRGVVVEGSEDFVAVVPFAGSFPFEMWIVPREHAPYFHHIDQQKAVDFGGLLKLMLQKLSKQLNDPPYNFMIHSTPFNLSADCLPYAHWFLQIVPQLSIVGGFEMGSGCYINPVFPEDAAKILRDVKCS